MSSHNLNLRVIITVRLIMNRFEQNTSLDINLLGSSGQTLLHTATEHESIGSVKVLVENPRTDVNIARLRDGATPLYFAAFRGSITILKMLLALPQVDVNKQANYGQTPLLASIMFGKEDCVLALLNDNRTNVNQSAHDGRTPLWCAARGGRNDCLELLLNHKNINVRALSINGETALHGAVLNGHYYCVYNILKFTPHDVNTRDQQVATPLMLAASLGRQEIIRMMLLSNFSDTFNTFPSWKATVMTALLCNAFFASKLPVLVWKFIFSFLRPCVDVNKPMTFDYLSDDNDDLQPGATALWLAAARGHALCVQLLLAHQSIDTNQPDQSGLTPLDIAKKNNHLLCVELLTSTTIRK